MTMLETIGRTRPVPLQHMVPEGSARLAIRSERFYNRSILKPRGGG